MRIIDVPGFGDSDGNDQKYTDALFKEIKALGKIDKFILVIKQDRMTSQIWEMLAIYREMFGNCWEHLIIVVTGVDFDSEEHSSIEEYQKDLDDEEKEI